MMPNEDTDGLCGEKPNHYSVMFCSHPFGHAGKHSYEETKIKDTIRIGSWCNAPEPKDEQHGWMKRSGSKT